MNTVREKFNVIDIQRILSFVLIGAIIIALAIGYNEKLRISGQKPFWTKEEVRTISIVTRVIVLIVAFIALAIAIKIREIAEADNCSYNQKLASNLEIIASGIAIIAAILILIAVNISENPIISIENPGL